MAVQKKLAVVIPLTPNFIMVGNQWVSIASFKDDELRAIGKEWAEKLIMKASQRRSTPSELKDRESLREKFNDIANGRD